MGVGGAGVFGEHTFILCSIDHIAGDALAVGAIAVGIWGASRAVGTGAIGQFDGVGGTHTLTIMIDAIFGAVRHLHTGRVVLIPFIALIALACLIIAPGAVVRAPTAF